MNKYFPPVLANSSARSTRVWVEKYRSSATTYSVSCRGKFSFMYCSTIGLSYATWPEQTYHPCIPIDFVIHVSMEGRCSLSKKFVESNL